MARKYKYIIIDNGNVSVNESADMRKVIKETFGWFDSTDYLFDDNLNIRAFVKEFSLFDCEPSVLCCQNDELVFSFNGTVIFSSLNEYSYSSLSTRDIQIILSRLSRIDDTHFRLSLD